MTKVKQLFIHLFLSHYLFSPYYVSSSVGLKDIVLNKTDKIPIPIFIRESRSDINR